MSYSSPSHLSTISPTSDSAQRWAVVGGGILGMALAHRLAQAGQRVTLFEAADELGGLASAWQFADTMWDRHYHVTLLSDLQLRSLLDELNLDQEMVWRKTKTGVYADGQLYSVSNAVEFLQFPALGWLDKFRLALTIWYGSKLKDGAKLEQISVVDWLRRWSGDRTFQKFWLPLLRAKLGSNYRKASAAFIWATIARLYAARSAGLKEELFGYLPGGYHRLLSEFARLLQQEGVEICLGHRARQVYSTRRTLDRSAAAVAPSANSVANPVAIEFANGAQRTFDQVVVTTAAPIAAQLIGELTDAEQARLNAIQYQGIVCASVLLKKPLSDYYVTNITDDGLPFTGVIEMTTLVDRREFSSLDSQPRSLVYLPKYVPSEDAALQQSDEAVRRSFLAGLERLYPAFHPSDVLDFRLSRVKYVMAVPTLNYSQQIPPIHTSVPGLHLVNSAQIVNATLNVNDTLKLVERSLPQLLTSVCTPS
ncbi:MAG: NAD(P)/FAD-dependent oxidoreductase [Synechococcales cyanobacterium RU_4_20]|nr:NAD(P)/FAD-dependent oxidoreductase [Synechococcales cyanobacterium RU_4_20]NJR69143.1 NAD(P)/FAD-dependent oxidoreductase [Synechococcales cyanobacterium CRU_2_2]